MIDRDEAEEALNRAPWCILTSKASGTAGRAAYIIGPFPDYQTAETWSGRYPGSKVVKMSTPELELAIEREHHEQSRH
jgi:hypothetical protein